MATNNTPPTPEQIRRAGALSVAKAIEAKAASVGIAAAACIRYTPTEIYISLVACRTGEVCRRYTFIAKADGSYGSLALTWTADPRHETADSADHERDSQDSDHEERLRFSA